MSSESELLRRTCMEAKTDVEMFLVVKWESEKRRKWGWDLQGAAHISLL